MKLNITKLLLSISLIVSSSQSFGYQCPQTLQQRQMIINQQGFVNPYQQQMLQQQCYNEISSYQQMNNGYNNTGGYGNDAGNYNIGSTNNTGGYNNPGGYSSPAATAPPFASCPSGLYQGQAVHSDRCLAGQLPEIIGNLLK